MPLPQENLKWDVHERKSFLGKVLQPGQTSGPGEKAHCRDMKNQINVKK